jgi:hypothetical protein
MSSRLRWISSIAPNPCALPIGVGQSAKLLEFEHQIEYLFFQLSCIWFFLIKIPALLLPQIKPIYTVKYLENS